MARKRDYEILARLKLKKKELEEQIKKKEAVILAHSPDLKVETPHGVLSLVARHNYSIPDNHVLISKSVIDENDFILNAKMSVSTLKKIVGEKEFVELVELGVVSYDGIMNYYTLKQNNGN
jgi:hypothetical protein